MDVPSREEFGALVDEVADNGLRLSEMEDRLAAVSRLPATQDEPAERPPPKGSWCLYPAGRYAIRVNEKTIYHVVADDRLTVVAL